MKEGDEIERNRAENGIRAQSSSKSSSLRFMYSPSLVEQFLPCRSVEISQLHIDFLRGFTGGLLFGTGIVVPCLHTHTRPSDYLYRARRSWEADSSSTVQVSFRILLF